MKYQELLSQAEENLRKTKETGKAYPYVKKDPAYEVLLESQERTLVALRKVGDIEQELAESDERLVTIENEIKESFKIARENLYRLNLI